MSNKLDATISITADTKGVEAGIDKTKKSLKTLGSAAQQAADQMGKSGKGAGAGFEAIGTGVAKSAKDVERATRSMQQQLQRQIAELNAGGKATREYTEALAKMRGVDARALTPLLDQLDQARKKAKDASEAAGGLASSLGNLKAIAATALAGFSLGTVASEITSVARETANAAVEFERFSTLSNTSVRDFQRLAAGANTAGVSAEKLADIFKDVQDKVGDFIQTGGGGMADFFEQVAPQVGVTADNFRKLSGKDALQLYVSSLEKANLSQSDMIFYMEAIASDSSLLLPLLKDQGQAWEELGARAEAYGAILDSGTIAAAKEFKTESENLEMAMKGLRVEIAEGVLPSMTQFTAMLSSPETRAALADLAGWIGQVAASALQLTTVIGGSSVWGWLQTGNTEAKDAAAEIANVEAQMEKVRETRDALANSSLSWMHTDDIALANKQLDFMSEKLRALQAMASQYAATQAAALRQMEAQSREGLPTYESLGDIPAGVPSMAAQIRGAMEATKSYRTLAEQMAEVRAAGKTASDALAELEKRGEGSSEQAGILRGRIAAVNEQLAKMGKSGAAGATGARQTASAYEAITKALQDKIEAQRQELIHGAKLTDLDKLRLRIEKELTGSRKANALAQLEIAEANAKELNAKEALRKADEDLRREREQSLKSVRASVKNLLEEAEAAAYAETHNVSLAEAVERLALARAEDAYQQAVVRGESQQTLDYLRREIEARRELVAATAQKAAREANKKAAQDAAKEWEKAAQTIERTLADYIMSGGKDGAEYLKRLFSTLVLQPIVQASVGGMMQSIGLGGAGGGAGMVGLAQDGSSLYSTFSGGLTGSFGAAIAGIGTAIGSSAATAFGSGVIAGGNLGLFGGGISQGLAAISGGSTAAGMGTILGAAMPWVAGISAVLSLVSGMLGGGTDDYGAAAKYSGGKLSDSGKAYTYAELTQSYAEGLQKPMDNLAKFIGSSLDGLAEMFGGKAGYSVTTGYTSDDDDPSRGIFIVENADGETLKKWLPYRSGEYGQRATGYSYDSDPEKGYDDYLKSVAAATIPIFKDIVPDWADAMLDGLVQQLGYSGEASDWKSIESGSAAMEALQQVLAQIAQVEAGFEALGKAMSMFADLSDDMKTGLLAAAGSMESLTTIASSYYNAVYSEEERMRAAAEQLDKQLADMGIFGERGGLSVYDTDAKAKLRQAVDELMDAGNAEAATKLMAMAASFVEIADWGAAAAAEAADAAKQAHEEARQAAIDAAWRNLEAAVDRESELLRERLSAVQESISTLESMRSMLKTNADALYGTVSAAAQMQAVQGMLYIEDALDAVRRGASLTGYDQLGDAVTAARGGLTAGVYVSQFDKDRDALVLANQLSELEGAAGMQLSVEERQLKVLNEQLDYYQRMLDSARDMIDGIHLLIDRTLTPEAAYELLMKALHGPQEGDTVQMQGGPHAVGGSSSSGGHAGAVSSSSSSAYDDYMRRASLSILGDRGATAQNREIKDVALSYSGTGDIAGLWSAVTAAGGNQYDIQRAYGWDIDDIERVLREQGVPGFAAGGLHSGGIRLVGERGPELEVTGPARYWDASKTMQMLQGGGGSDALAAEVRALREDQRAQAGEIVRLNARIARLLERWDGGGLPQQRQEAAV